MSDEISRSEEDEDLHERALGIFSDYLDGAATEEDAAFLTKHLESCGDCRDEFAEFEKTMDALSALHRVSAPQNFENNVEQTIHRRSGGRFFGRKAFGDRVPLEVLAVIALILGLVVFVVLRYSQTGSLRYEKPASESQPSDESREAMPRPGGQ